MGTFTSQLKLLVVVFLVTALMSLTEAADTPETKTPFIQELNGPIYDFILKQHKEIGEKFKSGDTNTPLLILEWFINDRYVQSSRVSQAGWVSLGDYGRMMGSGRGGFLLDPSQKEMLVKTMNELPRSPSISPQARWLLVSGVRSNAWFTKIYDRADIPATAEKLFEITHGRLQWIVGDADTSTNIAGSYGDTWVTSLRTATKKGIAVSSSAVASGRESNSIQLWDTIKWKQIMVPAIEDFTAWAWSAVTLSSNGRYVAMSSLYGARNVDQSTGKIRWDTKLPYDGSRVIKELTFVRNDAQLAVAFRNSVEIWDALTGKKLNILVTNEPEINLMKASRDGKLLAVVSNKNKIQIWDLGKREVVRETTDDPRHIHAIEFSPDANYLAISGFPYRDSFVLWDLKIGSKTAVPARGAQYSDEIESLAWSPDGKRFAATPQGREVMIYDVQTWKPIARWRGVSGDIVFTNDGTLLARLKDGSLRALYIYDLKRLVEH